MTADREVYEEKKKEIMERLKTNSDTFEDAIDYSKALKEFEQLVKSQAEQDLRKEIEKEINKLKFSCAVSRYKGDKWYIQEEEILKIVNKKEEAKGE